VLLLISILLLLLLLLLLQTLPLQRLMRPLLGSMNLRSELFVPALRCPHRLRRKHHELRLCGCSCDAWKQQHLLHLPAASIGGVAAQLLQSASKGLFLEKEATPPGSLWFLPQQSFAAAASMQHR
jgi:hypothetical protein